MALAIPGAIGSEVFITYIGLGLPADIPSLGNLINAGRKLVTSPSLRYQLIFPAIVLSPSVESGETRDRSYKPASRR